MFEERDNQRRERERKRALIPEITESGEILEYHSAEEIHSSHNCRLHPGIVIMPVAGPIQRNKTTVMVYKASDGVQPLWELCRQHGTYVMPWITGDILTERSYHHLAMEAGKKRIIGVPRIFSDNSVPGPLAKVTELDIMGKTPYGGVELEQAVVYVFFIPEAVRESLRIKAQWADENHEPHDGERPVHYFSFHELQHMYCEAPYQFGCGLGALMAHFARQPAPENAFFQALDDAATWMKDEADAYEQYRNDWAD